jgi:hypothetical protein
MQHNLSELLGKRLDELAAVDDIGPWLSESRTELIGDEFYLTIRSHGIAFVATFDGRISTVQLFSAGFQHYNQFPNELPEGITFADSRSSLRSRLGVPDCRDKEGTCGLLGPTPKWDIFHRAHYSLHVQYSDDEASVNLVSIMRPDAVPDGAHLSSFGCS